MTTQAVAPLQILAVPPVPLGAEPSPEITACAELWRDVYTEHLTIHDQGDTWADVTEGNPWPLIGLVWERLRYDWSQPDVVAGTVTDSNIFKPGSSWEIRAIPEGDGSRVEITAVRHLKGRGWLLWPFFPLGLARRDVAAYLRKFLDQVEADN